MSLNEKIFIILNQKLANPILDKILFFFLIPLFSLLILVPFWFLISRKKQLLGLFSLFCGFFLYWVGHSILKPIFGIPRPVDFFGKARVIGPWDPSSFSFPSTTTMLAFGVAFAIFLKERKIGSFLLILALLLGLALIYAGFHTPLDVLGGILFSLLFVLVIEKFVNWKNEK